MILSKNKWKVKYESPYSSSEVIDILYKSKGIDDYISYYNLGFKDFSDPYLFKNMDIVTKKIKTSIRNNEKIIIYGDYDVDGITATAILYRTLKEKGADIHFRVPNRFQNGYGLNMDVCEELISDGYNLLITVDNGITNTDEVDYLTKNGLSVIITDHHEPKEVLPNTPYILHSYIFNDYPFPNLCGAGVSFKLCEAIDKDFAWKYIDLVMLGTIADMMPQLGENKAIINEGLIKINSSECLGLKTLLEYLRISIKSIKDISFNIAPKLNSLGRISDATFAVNLLISEDLEEIDSNIEKIMEADAARKELTVENTDLAYRMIDPNDKVNIIYSTDFYEGVLGIIAQKVMKKTNKITGIFNVDSENNARGSFRTFGDYNVLDMLEKNKDLLDKFGGHEKACGANMPASNLKELKERLNHMVEETGRVESTINIELSLNHDLVSNDFVYTLEKYDLSDSMFLFEGLTVYSIQLLSEKHTKVKAKLKNNKYISIIVFNDARLSYNLSIGDKIDVAGTISINKNRDYEYLQIIAEDYRVPGFQVIDYRNRYLSDKELKYLDTESSLIIKENFDSLNELEILIKEEMPNIIYLFRTDEDFNASSINLLKLKEAIYLISNEVQVSSMILQKQLKISKQSMDTILTIFEELNLVTVQNGLIQQLPREKGVKVPLENSETYRELLERQEVLELMNSNIEDIKRFVINALE